MDAALQFADEREPDPPADEATIRAAIEKIKESDKPGYASEQATVEALARIEDENPSLYADLRHELRHAHPGVRIADVDRLRKAASRGLGLSDEEDDKSLADEIMGLVIGRSELFVD